MLIQKPKKNRRVRGEVSDTGLEKRVNEEHIGVEETEEKEIG
jgi:hypothetical protein